MRTALRRHVGPVALLATLVLLSFVRWAGADYPAGVQMSYNGGEPTKASRINVTGATGTCTSGTCTLPLGGGPTVPTTASPNKLFAGPSTPMSAPPSFRDPVAADFSAWGLTIAATYLAGVAPAPVVLDTTRKGILVDSHVDVTYSNSPGSGLNTANNAPALGVYDSTQADTANAGAPKLLFGVNRLGQIMGETVNSLIHYVWLIAGADAHIRVAQGTREGGDVFIEAGDGISTMRAGTVRLYGGRGGGTSGNGFVDGGVVIDAPARLTSHMTSGNSADFGQSDCSAGGDIAIGACNVRKIVMGSTANLDLGMALKAGAGGIQLYSDAFNVRKGDGSIIYFSNSDYASSPTVRGPVAAFLIAQNGAGTDEYRFGVNHFQTGIYAENITTGAVIFKASDSALIANSTAVQYKSGGASGAQYAQQVTGTVQTTDGTETTCYTFTPSSNSTVDLDVVVIGHKSDHSQGGRYHRSAAVRTTGGTANLVGLGTVDTIGVDKEDDIAWDVTVDVTGATARVRVTGAVGDTVTWRCKVVTTEGP